MQDGRRVGVPGSWWLVAGFFATALAWWVVAAAMLTGTTRELSLGWYELPQVVRAVHLVTIGFLPAAVAGAAVHVLPVLLRNGRPRARAWAALAGAWAGPPLAWGISTGRDDVVRPAAAVLGVALVLLLVEIGLLVARAPRGRMLLASRAGVALSCLHAAAAFAVGSLLYARRADSFLGVPHERLLAVHVVLGVLGWLTLLIVAVGRTLGPMLALAPSEGPRRLPVEELLLTGGVWLLVGGVAAASLPAAALGSAASLLALGRFGLVLARTAREHRLEGPEGPVVHFLLGLVLLVEASIFGLALLAGAGPEPRLAEAFALALLLGWAAGITVGHLGKLLALSAWTWWPPGPRPKQAALYPRRLWLAEAACFGIGVQTLVAAALAGSRPVATAGAALFLASTVLAAAAAGATGVRRHLLLADRVATAEPAVE